MNMKTNLLSLIILTVCMLTFPNVLQAQDDVCMAKAPSEVAVGRQFKYIVTVSERGEVLSYDFGKFELVNGPSIGSSTSITMSNGNVEQNTTYTYTYLGNTSQRENISQRSVALRG